MIFLSCQPDELYFIWQIQVQLFNFERLGINSNDVHVLFGIRDKTISSNLKQFLAENAFGKVFIYPDTRSFMNYASTIRPHIIRKHIEQFPELAKATIFYHDSDIIFTKPPAFRHLLPGDTWYASDTRSYISAESIVKIAGHKTLYEMAAIVEIDPHLLLLNSEHTGGAQYILKNTNSSFWQEIENTSEKLFNYLMGNPAINALQPWCADMWAILWTAWKKGQVITVDKALDFSWPHQPVQTLSRNSILHNCGVPLKLMDKMFCKGAFKVYTPFGINKRAYDQTVCASRYVEEIHRYSVHHNIKINTSTQSMKKRYTEEKAIEIISDILKIKAEKTNNLSQHDLLSISILLFHADQVYPDNQYKYIAEATLEDAASRPLSNDFSITKGATAFGLTLEHLQQHGFINVDIDDILMEVDNACTEFLLKSTNINIQNQLQIFSIIHYLCKRSCDSTKFMQAFEQAATLLKKYVHQHYKGFLSNNKLASIDAELPLLSLSCQLSRKVLPAISELVDILSTSILHYLYIRQNEPKLFTGRILSHLCDAENILSNTEKTEKTNKLLSYYASFLQTRANTILFPENIHLSTGIGRALMHHLKLAELAPRLNEISVFNNYLVDIMKDSIIQETAHKPGRIYPVNSFINPVCEYGLSTLAIKQPATLLQIENLYLS
ncbi:hypothetical protein SAMN05444266_10872 [Chitinophaga jiangningensis]|uniref:Uncharacterized protein n=1 Tax=Chitinophaga jiangningensis TaxID=1419482 RepID=A0A1M7IRP8_9BACT|nr:hypothetical protein [Chitinophaga jiangningensis]SHM43466.1 hypothetical protein SAMN05444266_10872 [Chitinophaga jiangningensis]